MNKETSSRREFIAAGLLAGLAAGCSAKHPFTQQDENVKASGEMVKLLSVDGEIIEVDKAFLKPVPDTPHVSNAEERKGIAGKSFVMVIDLSRCKNLKKCQAACDHMHQVHPGEHWIKVYNMQDAEHTAHYWQPSTCMHCDSPPCVKVCPVDATFKRQDGIVLIDNNRCIGCRFCMAACPYGARSFNWTHPQDPPEAQGQPYSAEHGFPRRIGTVEKCDFCPDMAAQGQLPACTSTCPMGAIYYGDENEDAVTNSAGETVRLSKLLLDRSGTRHLEELGTKPRVYYLPPKNR